QKAGEAAAASLISFAFKRKKLRLRLDRSESPVRLAQHLRESESWSREVAGAGLSRPRSFEKVFVDIDLNLTPLRERGSTEPDRTYTVSGLGDLEGNLVILGAPGAGKSTAMRHLLFQRLGTWRDTGKLPFLVRLRTLPHDQGILEYML